MAIAGLVLPVDFPYVPVCTALSVLVSRFQVLETYWCEWPGWSDCVIDDLPNIAGMLCLS